MRFGDLAARAQRLKVFGPPPAIIDVSALILWQMLKAFQAI
jgi:hypothetical protein